MAAPQASRNALINDDIAPVSQDRRSWTVWHIAALWVGMSVCIPTYMLAAGMVGSGMTWRQSLLTIFLGNAVVLVPLIVNAHAGTRYGIPFPVYARASFGIAGAHIPSLLRSLVACGWFGIQTWIGGTAITAILAILWPGWRALGSNWQFMGYGLPDYAGFLLFWAINIYFVWAGTESIKKLETLSAPFLIAVSLGLLGWASLKVGGLGVILRESDALTQTKAGSSLLPPMGLFLPWLTAMVGYWATLSLNIPDFSRYARSQKDQMLGQAIGLLTAMPLFAFVGIAVTGATVILYGEAIWNPVTLLARITQEQNSPWLGLAAMLVLALATLSTNIAANVVAPANSFSTLFPRRIGFRAGGLIAGAIAILILPWKLIDLYQVWLISYSGLLGAVGGVLLCDYLILRRMELSSEDLYSATGIYSYGNGYNKAALAAMTAGIAIALSGKAIPALGFLFDGAWFSATGVSFGVYWALMRGTGKT